MIKVANNLKNLIKMSSARRTLGIGTRLPYAGMRTDHPFNVHGDPGQHYYSYGDTPPTSVDPKYLEALNEYGHPNISGPDFAAVINTGQALSRMKFRPGNPSESYLPPRGPGYSPNPRTFAPSVSQLFDAARAINRTAAK